MKKEYEKNKSKVIDNNINGEDSTDEVYSAAAILLSLKHDTKFDYEQYLATLENQKRKILKGKYKVVEEEEEEEEPCLCIRCRNSKIYDDYESPDIPSGVAPDRDRLIIGKGSRPYQQQRAKTNLNVSMNKSSEADKKEEGPSIVIRIRNNSMILDGYQPPDIPPVPVLADFIGECSKPYEKKLTETDLKEDQMRLSLRKEHVQSYMLPLLREDENVGEGIPVITYDSEGKPYEMRFKLWGSKMYVITSNGWMTFCRDNGLVKEIDIVTVWMFRHRGTNKLCFVITTRRSPLTPWIGRKNRSPSLLTIGKDKGINIRS